MRTPVYPSDLWQKRYMRQLADQIREWKQAYYYGVAKVDDQEYDLWWRNLLFLESKYPHLKDPNSPTNGVGAPLGTEERVEIQRLSLVELQSSVASGPAS